MKVGELIRLLQDVNPNKKVVIMFNENKHNVAKRVEVITEGSDGYEFDDMIIINGNR